ncbi:beta-1,3-galactosyltransferase 5-like [Dendropsophus ebraccatus]|uniref:beta-1,3-galactosyltransferase 5-like n=1 Tax=Dendropsophus ebraccatus TaxID=150705 RepID=UPI00383147E8
MKLKIFFLTSSLLSATIFLTWRWIGASDVVVSRVPLRTPKVTNMIPVLRRSLTLNDGKYHYHLNLSSFESEFPHLQRYQCSVTLSPPVAPYDDSDLPLIIMAVKSHPRAGTRRSAIRQTWSKEQELKGYKIRRVFLVGRTEVSGHMEIVKVESAVYGDILQWDMTESHYNLSLKERCFLEWLNHNVPEADYIFKGDDDVFVNTEVVLDLIKDFGSPAVIHGFHQHRPGVMRYTKYSISHTLYPLARYPGFVSGGGFIFPGPAVPSLYEASRMMPVFPLDDVYFGFLALAANLTYRHDRRFRVQGMKYDVCSYKKTLLVHGISPERLLIIWRDVNESDC